MSEAEADFLEAGRKLFAGAAEFFFAAAKASGLPEAGAPEIAFAGRSNVGKSSLINALTGRNGLARASHTPGRTRELIFFDIGGRLWLVDMPGYGYAAVAKEMSAGWVTLVRDYLRGRPTLLRAFVLVDGRHGVKAVGRGDLRGARRGGDVLRRGADQARRGEALRAARARRGDGGGAEAPSGRLSRRCSSSPRGRARACRSCAPMWRGC